jgi:hypothetical protein
VHYVREVGEQQNVDFFNRLQFAYLKDDAVKLVHRDDLGEAFEGGEISDDTLFFDNLVTTKVDFLARWLVPFGESWMKRFI